MNMLLHWLTSPEWALAVKTLLHSLWQGAVVALVLALALRRTANPVLRYRFALTGLGAVMAATVITWGVLNAPKTPVVAPPQLAQPAPPPVATGPVEKIVVAANWTPAQPQTQWTAWLALVWLIGASAMLGRASVKVAGAEQLRRSCQPLNDPRIAELVAEARRAVKLTRQVRVAVTQQLTSPAVVGVLVPTLILPLSLITTLSPEQIRFVLLHELAHIRRGDYLANLFQLFAEALLFFNPAVWWLSHQIRREREACCDALAIELSGAPADYARTLVSVAETMLAPSPAAAPAFGNDREPSSLADRVQRVLVPGYRPSLRLTWRAMLTALVLGSAVLVLSAIGTRVTVAAAANLLTPQQRMERIEQKMAEYGQTPNADDLTNGEKGNDDERVSVTARVRTADGSPLPKQSLAVLHSTRERHSGSSFNTVWSNGEIKATVWPGQVWVEVEADGFAPAIAGPFDAGETNRIDAGEIVLQPGFEVALEVVDSVSGLPVPDAGLHTQFTLREAGLSLQNPSDLKTDSLGRAVLSHCVDQPLAVTVNTPGYELAEQRFESLTPGQTLRIAARRGGVAAGIVLDKTTGHPLSGATIRLYQQMSPEGSQGFGWDSKQYELATTGGDGRFEIHQLRANSRYWLGVTAPDRESVLLADVRVGKTNLVAQLGPALIVKCRVLGNLDELKQANGEHTIGVNLREGEIDGTSQNRGLGVKVAVRDGVGYFQFTNRIAGPVTVATGKRDFKRAVDAPVDNWVIDLSTPAPTNPPVAIREVVFRFKYDGAVPPRGTVEVTIPTTTDQNRPTARDQEMEIHDGEVRARMMVGGRASIAPKKTIGYYFENLYSSVVVTDGDGPQVIEIPTIPAGAIYATARNADGKPAGAIFFSVTELKPSPLRKTQGTVSGGVNSQAAKWVSGPLPLGGTYLIIGSRGNSFCVSKPITLTGEKPTAELDLQFPPSQTLECQALDASGRPVAGAEVEGVFSVTNHSFGLHVGVTDERGMFHIADATPGVGEYTAQVKAPGLRAEWTTLKFGSKAQVIRLNPGLKLTGSVVEQETGDPIPDAEVRVYDSTTNNYPSVTTRTDDTGHFEFTTLSDTTYYISVSQAEWTSQQVKGGQPQPITLKVKLPAWSQLKPKRSVAAVTHQTAVANRQEKTAPQLTPTSEARKQMLAKLESIRLDRVEFDHLPLSEVLRFLAAESKRRDPDGRGINFMLTDGSGAKAGVTIDPTTGSLVDADTRAGDALSSTPVFISPALTNVSLGDVLEAIVKNANRPLQYQVQDFAVIFSEGKTDAPPLFTRTFKVDANQLARSLETVELPANTKPPASTNLTSTLRSFFTGLGVDLRSPGKTMFYNDRTGMMIVRATAADLGIIEQAIQVLNTAPPQVNIRAKFVEVPMDNLGRTLFGILLPGSSNAISGVKVRPTPTNGFVGILTASQTKAAFKALEGAKGVDVLATPDVTTVSGRQAQLMIADIKTIVTGLSTVVTNGVTTNIYQTTPQPFGPVLDVIPFVSADGYTVQMTLTPKVTEFLGYDDPGDFRLSDGKMVKSLPLPRYRTRQATTSALVWDGQTIIIGGFVSEVFTRHPDGSETHKPDPEPQKKQLFVFITPTIIDPAGNRVHSEEEMLFRTNAVPKQPGR